MDSNEGVKRFESDATSARTTHPLSPRPTLLYPTTPSSIGTFTPFALFSEEKMEMLRVASPALSLDELARILAEEWASLPEDAKTPYKNRASQESVRLETVDAALVLTQSPRISFQAGNAFDDNYAADDEGVKKLWNSLPLESTLSCALSPGEEIHGGGSSGDSSGDATCIPDVTPVTPAASFVDRLQRHVEDEASSVNNRPCQLPATLAQATSKNRKRTASKKRKDSSACDSLASPSKLSKSARKKACKAGQLVVANMSKKDPSRPKRNQSSYMMFYTERCDSYKTAKPGMTTMDLGRALGEAWRNLSDEEKLPYTQRAKADRERYENELCAIAQYATANTTVSSSISV